MMYGLVGAKRLLKYYIIRAGLNTIYALHLDKVIPSAAKNGLIFTLHHVRPVDNSKTFCPNAILSITPDFLEETIKTVLKAGMIPVHVHDLPKLLADNPKQYRFVCFTLDDGYRNNADYAAPIFRRYNIPYTIYITTGFAEHRNILWWETVERLLEKVGQLSFDFGEGNETLSLQSTSQKMSAFNLFARFVDEGDEDNTTARIIEVSRTHGINPLHITRELIMSPAELRHLAENDGKDGLVHFGAHSVSHINLSRTDENRMYDEISRSTCWLKNNLGMIPNSFSYPYGWKTAVNEHVCNAARRAGFSIAVTTQPGMLTASCLLNPQIFPRVSLNGYFQKQRYVSALISGVPFLKLR